MFILFLLYIISTLLIFWCYSGYIYFLLSYFLLRRGFKKKLAKKSKTLPQITIIIPSYNEEEFVEEKLKDISNSNYPNELIYIIWIDGQSKDKTQQLAEKHCNKFFKDAFKVIRSKKGGKIHQLNEALDHIPEHIEYLVNTDVDTRLETNTLKILITELQENPDIGVAGACVLPKNCNKVEKSIWANNNIQRILESEIYSSSIVIAPCYAFKRLIIKRFPIDCIADDVYISFLTHSLGFRATYLKDALAYEIRAPKYKLELISHKFRKANAYLREILRFLYLLPNYNLRWQFIYFTKVLQFLLLPVSQIVFTLISINIFFIDWRIVVSFATFLGINILLTSLILKRIPLPNRPESLSLSSTIFLFSMMNFVTFFAVITYFFYKQESQYKRI